MSGTVWCPKKKRVKYAVQLCWKERYLYIGIFVVDIFRQSLFEDEEKCLLKAQWHNANHDEMTLCKSRPLYCVWGSIIKERYIFQLKFLLFLLSHQDCFSVKNKFKQLQQIFMKLFSQIKNSFMSFIVFLNPYHSQSL